MTLSLCVTTPLFKGPGESVWKAVLRSFDQILGTRISSSDFLVGVRAFPGTRNPQFHVQISSRGPGHLISPVPCLLKSVLPNLIPQHTFTSVLHWLGSIINTWFPPGELCSIILVKGEHEALQISTLRLMELTCYSSMKYSMSSISSLSVPFPFLLQLNLISFGVLLSLKPS